MYAVKNNAVLLCDRKIKIINAFRKLWEQHGMWTRSFIVSTAHDLPDLELVTQRLLRNPDDFAKELQKYYGPKKAQTFRDLLREHLAIAAQLVNEVKQGEYDEAQETRKLWYENADQLAAFLSAIDPFSSRQLWQSLWYEHLKMVEDEAAFRLGGEYAQDIALYDDIETQALKMADLMASGIIKQQTY